jgi:spore coat protein U-like protein
MSIYNFLGVIVMTLLNHNPSVSPSHSGVSGRRSDKEGVAVRVSRLALVGSGLLGTLVLGLQPMVASAATTVTTFQVAATVPSSCTATIDTLNFGNYDGSHDVISTTIIKPAGCNVTYTIALNTGVNADTTTTPPTRRLASGGNFIAYNLYQDQAYTIPWGDGTGGTSTLIVGGTGATLASLNQPITIYGKIPAMVTAPAPGLYTDTLTATITF